MIIQQKIDKDKVGLNNRSIDLLPLAWYETNKRILHKSTLAGLKITLKFLKEDPGFSQGDILFDGPDFVVMIDIMPCEAIVVTPGSMFRMASLCYEIGNKHLPLFINNDEVLVPFEAPLFQWLTATGFEPVKESRKLLQPLKTTTMAHSHATNGGSIFSRIMQLTKSSNDE